MQSPLPALALAQVPDIYDAAKHALIHNAYLPLGPANQQHQQDPPASAATAAILLVGHLVAPLYLTARRLADVVVPHEYGLDPKVRSGQAPRASFPGAMD